MPKAYEPCPECRSGNTRLMRQRRKCLDCGHTWQPSTLGVCPWCHSSSSEANPKDDPYIRKVTIPRLKHEEEFYEEQMREMVESHPAWEWVKYVKGAGLTSIARIIGKTDIQRIETASEMWAHCGFGVDLKCKNGHIWKADASTKCPVCGNTDIVGIPQGKHKGMSITYNAQLQSNCVMLGESLMRGKDAYYRYYLKQKEIHSDLPLRHCHNRAFRHMIKLFLSHFWQTWREAEGLQALLPYAFGILNHPEGHLIGPWEMVKAAEELLIRQR